MMQKYDIIIIRINWIHFLSAKLQVNVIIHQLQHCEPSGGNWFRLRHAIPDKWRTHLYFSIERQGEFVDQYLHLCLPHHRIYIQCGPRLL